MLVAGKLAPLFGRRHELMNSKTQVAFANEGAEKKQKEEEVAARKRKLEEKEKWEGESRFNSHITILRNLTGFPSQIIT